jgi:PPK2 family polyphosphate:nucleotide phosphotransferase
MKLSAIKTRPPKRGKDWNKAQLAKQIEKMTELQDKLYASRKKGVLVLLQAMDAAGKDTVIKHAMGGINPQGCHVRSFKQPTQEELDHDFLWRVQPHLPAKGYIAIFNRSYYEEVLVLKVHPELLARQGLEDSEELWKHRYHSIREFERHLHRNGTEIIKIFLHVSKAEQKKRFLQRIEDTAKNWKFSDSDVREREHWEAYQKAYQHMLDETSSRECPWHVVPADDKWAARRMVAQIIVEKLKDIDPAYPASRDVKILAAARTHLEKRGA